MIYCKRKDMVEQEACDVSDRILISILNTVQTPLDEKTKNRYKDVLELTFDDLPFDPCFTTEEDLKGLTAFKSKHLREIMEFIEKYRYVRDIDVHCSAGVSRSGAVALGIAMLKDDKELFNRILKENLIFPNEFILMRFYMAINPTGFQHMFFNIYSELNKKIDLSLEVI